MKLNQNYVYSVREVITFREMLESSCELYPDNIAFLYRKDGEIATVSYSEYLENVKALATYLNSKGLSGKRIAVSGKNSYNWALTYMAVCCGCGVVVPVDKDLPRDEAEYILSDSETCLIMVAPELEEKFEDLAICQKLYMKDMESYIAEGRRLIAEGNTSYNDHRIIPDDLGVLIYTSGTTGVAKGVMLSQRNICTDITSVLKYVKLRPTDRCLSVLPLHHTYECTAGFLGHIYSGASIAYNDSLRTLKNDLQTFKPTVFVAVPMILESFLKLVREKYNAIPGGNAVFAVQKAASKVLDSSRKKRLFSAVTEAFGGNLRLILCGAAPLSPETYKAYINFGITVYIGYGLTETSPITLMHTDFYRSATDNGFPPAGIHVKILNPDEDGKGELAVKGSNVMLGYYKMPEETAEVMCDGWFRTGDLAKQNPNGTFTIIGRLKSMIVAKNGKKIFPEELEYKLSKNVLVKECMVFGTGDRLSPTVTAAIFPDHDEMAKKLGYTKEADPQKYRDDVKKVLSEIVENVNTSGMPYKAIKKLIIRNNEFEKTTTRKIKRNSPDNLNEEQES